MARAIAYELRMFRSLADFLAALGLPKDRAELWARSAVDRYRQARRHGISAEHLFTLEHAKMYAERDELGCSPREWI